MLQSIKKSWREFRHAPPGQRFERRHEKRRRERAKHPFAGPLYIGVGIVLLLVGLVFMAGPGPGIPVVLVGAAFIAGESLPLARMLDHLELWLRRQWGKKA